MSPVQVLWQTRKTANCLSACLVDVKWEYRDRAAVDLDHQSALKLFKMSDNNRKEELEKKKPRLQAMR